MHDERYLDTIDRQWGEKKQLEEQEKLEKVKCVRGVECPYSMVACVIYWPLAF